VTTGPAPVPQPAATIVLLRHGPAGPEVLLTRRPASMAFAADVYVFPGGRVDPEDERPASADGADAARAAAALGDNLAPAEALAIHRAAIRELREEAGVTVDGIDRLAPIAHWTTPTFMPRRFSTWFFVADLPPGVEPAFAPDEVTEHRWLTPAAALAQMAAREIGMWVPTTSVLQRLVEIGATSAADVGRAVTFRRVGEPVIVEDRPARIDIRHSSAGAIPGRDGTATLHGRRDLVLVDPGDPSEGALDAIASAVAGRGGAIRAIVLTATDPDHAAGAEALAIPLKVPVLVAPGAGRHLPYAAREATDGELLPADVELRVRLGRPGSGRLEVVVGSAGE
jgi:8-oxo-dGTP pyrophosphatase MutT (NUDIX family)